MSLSIKLIDVKFNEPVGSNLTIKASHPSLTATPNTTPTKSSATATTTQLSSVTTAYKTTPYPLQTSTSTPVSLTLSSNAYASIYANESASPTKDNMTIAEYGQSKRNGTIRNGSSTPVPSGPSNPFKSLVHKIQKKNKKYKQQPAADENILTDLVLDVFAGDIVTDDIDLSFDDGIRSGSGSSSSDTAMPNVKVGRLSWFKQSSSPSSSKADVTASATATIANEITPTKTSLSRQVPLPLGSAVIKLTNSMTKGNQSTWYSLTDGGGSVVGEVLVQLSFSDGENNSDENGSGSEIDQVESTENYTDCNGSVEVHAVDSMVTVSSMDSVQEVEVDLSNDFVKEKVKETNNGVRVFTKPWYLQTGQLYSHCIDFLYKESEDENDVNEPKSQTQIDDQTTSSTEIQSYEASSSSPTYITKLLTKIKPTAPQNTRIASVLTTIDTKINTSLSRSYNYLYLNFSGTCVSILDSKVGNWVVGEKRGRGVLGEWPGAIDIVDLVDEMVVAEGGVKGLNHVVIVVANENENEKQIEGEKKIVKWDDEFQISRPADDDDVTKSMTKNKGKSKAEKKKRKSYFGSKNSNTW